ncbi:MAG: pantoate--beta-alanine ligase [Kiloniellales bacterium]|nr:pantoate--beta-alanine ligase [Kiloniellales bacterium]
MTVATEERPGAVAARPQALRTLRRVDALRDTVARWRRSGQRIGLVPTMGALHDGHLALVRRARAECDRVIATLFVNPKQFNDADDLESYPRDETRDAALLQAVGTDLLYAPTLGQIYPAGFQTVVSLPALSACLCGAARPGHMDGVATVVSKLLNQAAPDLAYFGEKDYQQLLLITRMARDLDIPVTIRGVATVREPDGLALSSRNALLDAKQRRIAPALYRVLSDLARRLASGAEAAPLLDEGRRTLARAGFDPVDYLELRDGRDLGPLERAGDHARLFAAASLGPVRLIDNLAVVRATGPR